MTDNASGGIQFLPESRRDIEVIVPGENKLLVIGAILLFLASGIWGGLLWFSSTLEEKVQTKDVELSNLEKQRDKGVEQNLFDAKAQLSQVGAVLDNHFIGSRLLTVLQNRTSPQTQYKKMSIDVEKGAISAEAEALNYTAVAKQIASYLSEDLIKDVNLSESSVQTTGRVLFKMTILFDRGSFQLSNLK